MATLPDGRGPEPTGGVGERLLYLALLLLVATPSILLLLLFGSFAFLMSVGSGLASLGDPAAVVRLEPLVSGGIALVIASGFAAIVLLALHSVRYLVRGRAGLRRRALWRMHAFAAPALAFCILVAADRLSAQGFEAGEVLFAIAISGVPVLPSSLFLLLVAPRTAGASG